MLRFCSPTQCVLSFLIASVLQLLASSPNSRPDMLRVDREQHGDLIQFYAINVETGRVTATFEASFENAVPNIAFPFTQSFEPGKRTLLFWMEATDRTAPWRYRLTQYFTMGTYEAVQDTNIVYNLPYPANRGFMVSQGYGGKVSQTGSVQYAVDFRMPEGTPILAARNGRVVALKNDSNRGGADKNYLEDANFILVEHQDGTMADYAHFRFGGVMVKVGQHVKAGDLIGYSGNTGFSTGPHLHFCVFRAKDGRSRESLPIKFKTSQGVLSSLQEGKKYATRPSSFPILGRLF